MGGELKKGLGGAATALTGINLASVGVAGAIIGVAAALKYSVEQAAEAEKIMAITESVIKATGGAAGLTATEIEKMAGRLSKLNAIDDETIQSAQNLLLTFKKIKGEGFEAASQAAIDLSVVMGTDLRGAAMMVGKALEDPVRGVTALRRAGVSFTAEQQKMIKSLVETGRAAEAQEFILRELNSQVGGAGVAVAKTYAGQMVLLKTNVDNLAESVGMKLLPALTGVTAAINNSINIIDAGNAAVDAGVVSWKEYQQIQIQVGAGVLTNEQAHQILTDAMEVQASSLASEDTKFRALIPVVEEYATATSHAGRENVNTAGTADRLAEAEETLKRGTIDTIAAERERIDSLQKLRVAQDLANDAANRGIVAFYNLAGQLKDATAADLARASLELLKDQLDKGAISGDEYKAAAERLMISFGLATPASLAMATATDTLVKLFGAGRITADELTTATGLLEKAAADGKVDLEELGISVGNTLTPALEIAGGKIDRISEGLTALDGRHVTATATVNTYENTYRTTWVTSQGLDPTEFEHGGPSGSFGSGGTLVAPASFGGPAPSTSAARNRGGAGGGNTFNVTVNTSQAEVDTPRLMHALAGAF